MNCKWCQRKLHWRVVKLGRDECTHCRKRLTWRIQRELGRFVGLALWRNFYMGRNT